MIPIPVTRYKRPACDESFDPELTAEGLSRVEADSQGPDIDYQLDFTTPGSLPWDANTRKQIRQSPNFLRYALGRPQTGHRLYCLTLNLGFRIAFILSAFFAKLPSLISIRHAH